MTWYTNLVQHLLARGQDESNVKGFSKCNEGLGFNQKRNYPGKMRELTLPSQPFKGGHRLPLRSESLLVVLKKQAARSSIATRKWIVSHERTEQEPSLQMKSDL